MRTGCLVKQLNCLFVFSALDQLAGHVVHLLECDHFEGGVHRSIAFRLKLNKHCDQIGLASVIVVVVMGLQDLAKIH